MPFLKVIKISYANKKIQSSKINGLRHRIFSPGNKKPFEAYYVGEWENNIKEGRGKELDRNGWIYNGQWHNDKKHGCGTLSKISKEDRKIRRYYIGEWFAGKKQGFGHNWYEDNSYYEGIFCQNKRHGYGHIWYCNGDYYEGYWDNDLYHGMGLLIKDNGNKYEGQFVRGKKDGYGTFYHVVTGQEQRGLWRDDFFINGIMIDSDFRQSAIYPTPYPIPPVELMEDKSNEAKEDISEDNAVPTATSIEHSCKKRKKRIIGNFCVSINTCPCLESIK